MANLRKYKSSYSSTSNSFGTGTSETITPASVVGLPTGEITLTFDRVNSSGVSLGSKVERIKGSISGGNFVISERGVDGTTEQAHTSPVVEMVWNAEDWNDAVDAFLVAHNDAGTHKSGSVLTLPQINDTSSDHQYVVAVNELAADRTVTLPLLTGNDEFVFKDHAQTLTNKTIDANSNTILNVASFWSNVPGTPTRVSDTQFTITDTSNANLYDLLFKKGVVLKWLESSTFQTAMVISSSYSSNTVTINLVGDSLTAGFTSMQYAIPRALRETFIIPGTIATGTDLAKTWYVAEPVYILSADAYVKTAGTTNSTVFDINDDGSTKFTTKPTITTGTTSDIDNVSDNPSTTVAAASLITVDVDSVSTTAPVEAYIDVWYYPESWRYR